MFHCPDQFCPYGMKEQLQKNTIFGGRIALELEEIENAGRGLDLVVNDKDIVVVVVVVVFWREF